MVTMISKRQRRRTMPPQSRRQRNLAIACALAIVTLGPRNDDVMDKHDGLSMSSFFLTASAAPTGTNQQHPSNNNNESNDETALPRPLNYYELLNLETPDTHRRSRTGTLLTRKKRTNYRSKILTNDIKKAYRKQAQLYHPDKANRHNMTIAEATSKFAEIAEAYQALTDPVQRYEYDWDLLDMEEEYEEERLLVEEEQREVRKDQQREQRQQQSYNMGGEDISLYEKIRNGASNFHAWKDTLNLDPWAVFEDFFFQDSTMGDASFNPNTDDYRNHQQGQTNSNSYNYQSNNQGKQQHQSRGHNGQEMPPQRVTETTMYRGYDPSFGADVYTVLRREEYTHDINASGEYYYQILGQDFISGTRVDPYTGFTMQEYYSAVTEPYFVEEGYSKQKDSHEGGRNNNYAGSKDFHYKHQHQNQQQQQQTQQQHQRDTAPHRTSSSKLEEGESFTPNSTESNAPWISPNGRYQAILTPTCELQIADRDVVGDADADSANTVVWTSETYIPNTRAHGCYLTLNSMGSLVLSVDYGSGLGSVGNTVLWNTPLPPVVPHWFAEDDDSAKQQPVTFRYYASLDDDGVIAVYRARERVDDDGTDNIKKEEEQQTASPESKESPRSELNNIQTKLRIRPIIAKLGVMYHRISKSSATQGQTKAALAWDQLRYNVGRIVKGRPWTVASSTVTTDDEDQQSSPNPNINTRYECIYSTSPVGCLAPGRNAIHLTKKIARSIKRSVQTMDSHLDHFLSVLTEPASDYDYDDYSYDGSNYPDFNHDDDDDEDVLDTLLRVTGAAGAQLGKAGMNGIHAAQLGMRRGQKVAGKMVGKMKDSMGKHSIHRWGERMAEKEEVDIFF